MHSVILIFRLQSPCLATSDLSPSFSAKHVGQSGSETRRQPLGGGDSPRLLFTDDYSQYFPAIEIRRQETGDRRQNAF